MPKQTDVVIVGGGAAGLICAGFAARRGRRVVALEKMERCGRKLMITGKGRCNLTNDCGVDALVANTRTNGRFLYSAFSAFPPQEMMALMRGLGVPVKTERGNRVFPVSDKSVDVVDALVRFARESGAEITTGCRCGGLLLGGGRVKGVNTAAGDIFAESVVVATGGLSYPLTGSTGDGYRFAEEAGHAVVPQRASLIPIVAAEDYCRDLMGLSLRNCRLTLLESGRKKPVFSELGELLFTHFGVSGPLVLSASAHMRGEPSNYRLLIDLKPGLSPEQLDARLRRDFEANINRDFANSLSALLPRKLIPVVVSLSGIDAREKVNAITRTQRQGLVELVKALPVTPVGFRPVEEAVVTCGGVSARELDPRTMESKLVKGLYFAGEVVDVDAYTGGFNLQIAFSTGYAAGMHV